MTNKERMLLGGVLAVMCVITIRPAHSSDRVDDDAQSFIDKAVVVGEDARVEHTVAVRDAAAVAALRKSGNAQCQYSSAALHPEDRAFRFADGNQVVFPAAGKNSMRFVATDGVTTEIEDGEGVARNDWWCQEDGVVLFRTVQATGGKLSAVKVEWFDSRGARKTETQVNIAPYGDKVGWSYESARTVDDCLGLTFRVQENKASEGSAKLVEYKLCPRGI